MFEILKSVYKFMSNKFIKFLLNVWKGTTGMVLDAIYGYVNEVVKNVENISKYIKNNPSKSGIQLQEELRQKYGYREIGIDFILNYRLEKEFDDDDFKFSKMKLAYEIIKNRCKNDGVYFIQRVVILSIQLAVNTIKK